MNAPVFLVDELPTADTTVLGGAEGRHAATVRRLRPGERVDLADGVGGLAECTVVGGGRDTIEVAVLDRRRVPAPTPRLVAVQALAKGDRGELAVELMTEGGVDEIVPWQAARSVARWSPERAEKAVGRWRSTAREAAKQSRRAWLPAVSPLATTGDVSARLAAARCAIVLHEEATASLGAVDVPTMGEVVIVIGPEGGLDAAELADFTAAGAQAVRLGRTVFRTSSAGLAALSVLSARLGRWD